MQGILDASPFTYLFILVSVMGLAFFNAKAYVLSKHWQKAILLLIIHLAFSVLLYAMSKSYLLWVHLSIYLAPSFVLSFVFYSKKKAQGIFDVFIPSKQGGISVNLQRSFGVFGSSGAGKTESLFSNIIKHMSENDMPGINYDYKDFELSELVYYYYEQNSSIPVYTFSPTNVSCSNRLNPISPEYLDLPEDVLAICEVLVTNLGANLSADAKIFSDSASGALAGTIWVLKTKYPDKCTLPIACSILLLGSMEEIFSFIEQDTQARILASEIFESQSSEKLLGSIKVALVNFIKRLATPPLYYLLSGNDLSLKLNNPGSLGVLNIVNHPKYADVYSPVLALIMQVAILQMSERNKVPSIMLVDEGSTIKIPNFQRVLATLRSYNVATVWGLQDKVQGELLYKVAEVKAILANISTKVFGKVNDPDTAQYYERFFPFVQRQVTSHSRGSGFLARGEARVNISEKEQRQERAEQFYSLNQGEFFVQNERGKIVRHQIKRPSYERKAPKYVKMISPVELEENFALIHQEAKNLIQL